MLAITLATFLFTEIYVFYAGCFFKYRHNDYAQWYVKSNFYLYKYIIHLLIFLFIIFIPAFGHLKSLRKTNPITVFDVLMLPVFNSQDKVARIILIPISILYYLFTYILMPIILVGFYLNRSTTIPDSVSDYFTNNMGPAVLGNIIYEASEHGTKTVHNLAIYDPFSGPGIIITQLFLLALYAWFLLAYFIAWRVRTKVEKKR